MTIDFISTFLTPNDQFTMEIYCKVNPDFRALEIEGLYFKVNAVNAQREKEYFPVKKLQTCHRIKQTMKL